MENDHNSWIDIYDHPLFYIGQILLAILCLLLIGFCFIGIVKDWLVARSITTKNFLLGCEICTLLLLFINVIDLGYSRGLLNLEANRTILQLSFTFAAITNLLLAFFFLELFSQHLTKPESFLSVYKVHFIVLFFLILMGRMVCGILASLFLFPPSILQLVAGLLPLIAHIIAIILLCVVLVKACVHANSEIKYVLKIRKALTEFVIVCIVLSLAFELPWILAGTVGDYVTRICVLFFTTYCAGALSLFKIYKLVYVPLRKSKKTGSSQPKEEKDNSSKKSTTTEASLTPMGTTTS